MAYGSLGIFISKSYVSKDSSFSISNGLSKKDPHFSRTKLGVVGVVGVCGRSLVSSVGNIEYDRTGY
jgi:hypothetical protein